MLRPKSATPSNGATQGGTTALSRLPPSSLEEHVILTRTSISQLFERSSSLVRDGGSLMIVQSLEADVIAAIQRLCEKAIDLDAASLKNFFRTSDGPTTGLEKTMARLEAVHNKNDVPMITVEESRVVAMHREIVSLRQQVTRLSIELDGERVMCERKNGLLDYIRQTLWQDCIALREQLFVATRNPAYVSGDILTLLDTVPLLQSSGNDAQSAAAVANELQETKKRNAAELAKMQAFFADQLKARDGELTKLKQTYQKTKDENDRLSRERVNNQAGSNAELRSLRADIDMKDDRIASLTTQVEELRQQVASQLNLISGYKEQLQKVNTNVGRLVEERDRELVLKSQQLADAEAKAKSVDAFKAQVTLVQQKYDAAMRTAVEKEEEAAQARKELAAAVAERDQALAEADQWKTREGQTAAMAANTMRGGNSQQDALRKRITALERELSDAASNFALQTKRADGAEARVAYLEKQLEDTLSRSPAAFDRDPSLSIRSPVRVKSLPPTNNDHRQSPLVEDWNGETAPPAALVAELVSSARERSPSTSNAAAEAHSARATSPVVVMPSVSPLPTSPTTTTPAAPEAAAATGNSSLQLKLLAKERNEWKVEKAAMQLRISALSEKEAQLTKQLHEKESTITKFLSDKATAESAKRLNPSTRSSDAVTTVTSSRSFSGPPSKGVPHPTAAKATLEDQPLSEPNELIPAVVDHSIEVDPAEHSAHSSLPSVATDRIKTRRSSSTAGMSLMKQHLAVEAAEENVKLKQELQRLSEERESALLSLQHELDVSHITTQGLQRNLEAAQAQLANVLKAAAAAVQAANDADERVKKADDGAVWLRDRIRSVEAELAVNKLTIANLRHQVKELKATAKAAAKDTMSKSQDGQPNATRQSPKREEEETLGHSSNSDTAAAATTAVPSFIATVVDDNDEDDMGLDTDPVDLVAELTATSSALAQERALREQATSSAARSIITIVTDAGKIDRDAMGALAKKAGAVMSIDDNGEGEAVIQMSMFDPSKAVNVLRTLQLDKTLRGVAAHTGTLFVDGQRTFGPAAIVCDALATAAAHANASSSTSEKPGPLVIATDALIEAAKAVEAAAVERYQEGATSYMMALTDEVSTALAVKAAPTLVLWSASPSDVVNSSLDRVCDEIRGICLEHKPQHFPPSVMVMKEMLDALEPPRTVASAPTVPETASTEEEDGTAQLHRFMNIRAAARSALARASISLASPEPVKREHKGVQCELLTVGMLADAVAAARSAAQQTIRVPGVVNVNDAVPQNRLLAPPRRGFSAQRKIMMAVATAAHYQNRRPLDGEGLVASAIRPGTAAGAGKPPRPGPSPEHSPIRDDLDDDERPSGSGEDPLDLPHRPIELSRFLHMKEYHGEVDPPRPHSSGGFYAVNHQANNGPVLRQHHPPRPQTAQPTGEMLRGQSELLSAVYTLPLGLGDGTAPHFVPLLAANKEYVPLTNSLGVNLSPSSGDGAAPPVRPLREGVVGEGRGGGLFAFALAEQARSKKPELDPAWRQYPDASRFSGGADSAAKLSMTHDDTTSWASPTNVDPTMSTDMSEALATPPLSPEPLSISSSLVVDPRGAGFTATTKNTTNAQRAVRGVKDKIKRSAEVSRLTTLLGDDFTRPGRALSAGASASPNALAPPSVVTVDEATRRAAIASRARGGELVGRDGKVVGIRGHRPASATPFKAQ